MVKGVQVKGVDEATRVVDTSRCVILDGERCGVVRTGLT